MTLRALDFAWLKHDNVEVMLLTDLGDGSWTVVFPEGDERRVREIDLEEL